MHLTEFECLSEREQLDMLYKQGVYIGKQNQRGDIHIMLQLDSFYVEIEYKKYRQYIKSIKCFENPSPRLDPYLSEINIEFPVTS